MDAPPQRAQQQQQPLAHRQQQTQAQTPDHDRIEPQAERNTTAIGQAAAEVPKEGNSAENRDPPPAYTPPLRTRLQQDLAAVMLRNPEPHIQQLGQRVLCAPLPSAILLPSSDADEDSDEDLSPINLRISTRVNVSRDNNLIALPYSPSDQANATAEAIVKAFKSGTVMEGGIPMIDQDGRPRPIKIEVDAGITVEGSSNIVGTEAIISDVLRNRSMAQAQAARAQRMAAPGGGAPVNARANAAACASGSSSGSTTPSRRRSAGEMEGTSEAPASKKPRSQE